MEVSVGRAHLKIALFVLRLFLGLLQLLPVRRPEVPELGFG